MYSEKTKEEIRLMLDGKEPEEYEIEKAFECFVEKLNDKAQDFSTDKNGDYSSLFLALFYRMFKAGWIANRKHHEKTQVSMIDLHGEDIFKGGCF